MRIVLIVQSLIILAGAYYVYTLTRPNVEESDEMENPSIISDREVRQDTRDGHTVNTTHLENDVSVTTNEVQIMEGHNDLGMEFPTPDDEWRLEVR